MFKFMLTILGAVAEMERELTVERVREGIRKAQQYGTRSGRPLADHLERFHQALKSTMICGKKKRLLGLNLQGYLMLADLPCIGISGSMKEVFNLPHSTLILAIF
jgi:hypothetical protein